ncbi:enamine deaminase RidA (YjgF/YER057c/UK114 family) [Hydrogenophaga palleronii]|uniref:Enamine deaminase RidA (YjgF/YER057c/UK114 family) n=1 Tax=Hydrogenophaga palleronii TaxID=65655 RepID=A0ABU1WR69_9BURK|nr:RidA family protein [Hydrogenophaga palleronii]MDR7151781.1 enamine deaminase RidA (YjgF/YER057c/UK114 family) [Hydrogenophaga palleronii]
MSTPATPPLSKFRTGGNLVFLSGELPFKEDGGVPEGIEAQTALTIDRIEATLKAQGLGLSDVISVTAYLIDAADFAAFNQVYAQRFQQPYPARTTVRADLMRPGPRLELTAVALAQA